MLDLKQSLKQFPPFMAAYSRWMAAKHHRKNDRLARDYDERARQAGLQYSEALMLAEYHKRVGARGISLPVIGATGSSRPLRIFYFGANEAQDNTGFLQSLQRLGKVYLYTHAKGGYGPLYWHGRFDQSIIDENTRRFWELYQNAEREGPIDLLIGQMWANYFDVRALQSVQAQGTVVINIAMDDRGVPELWDTIQGVRMGAIGLAPGCDMVLNTSPESCIRYLLDGCPCLFWPLASDPLLFSPAKTKDIAVSFIGSRYGVRGKFIDSIREAGIPIDVYGPGWEKGPVDAKQATEIFSRSRILLGVGFVGYTTDIVTMKLRDFDAPMSGAAYVTSRNPDLYSFLEEGREVLFYDSVDECISLLQELLADEKLTQQLGQQAHVRAKRDHSWDTRLHQTFRKLSLIP